jgi:hypothetical protein
MYVRQLNLAKSQHMYINELPTKQTCTLVNGVNVIITKFSDFCQLLEKKWGFLENQ